MIGDFVIENKGGTITEITIDGIKVPCTRYVLSQRVGEIPTLTLDTWGMGTKASGTAEIIRTVNEV